VDKVNSPEAGIEAIADLGLETKGAQSLGCPAHLHSVAARVG
jgi:hypothetical protein